MKVRRHAAVAAAALAMAVSSFAFAEIKGKVTLDGKAPEMKEIDMSAVKECAAQHADPVYEETVIADEKGNLANVIVAIKKAEGQDLPGDIPSEPAVLDQKGCQYVPHVLAMMAGQDFMVKNDDPFLHNVHALSTVNPPFNFGQPNKHEGQKVDSIRAEEYFRVKCDVHPWMSAYIGVFEHPFFAVTKEDGTYEIKTEGLADGEYTLTFWHEKFASETPVEETIEVKDGKAQKDYTFKAEAAAAEPADAAKVILASDNKAAGEAKACCSTGTLKLEKVAATK